MKQQNKQLPKGWKRPTLGKEIKIKYGKGLAERNRNNNGKIPVYGSAGKIGFHDKSLVNFPTVIVARKGSIGNNFIVKESCWAIDTVYYLEDVKLNLDYLYYYLNFSVFKDTSTAVPSLRREDLEAIKINYPKSFQEQQLIVSTIETQFTRLDAAVKSLKVVKEKLGIYRKAVLKKAFEGKPLKPLQDFCENVKKDIVDGPFGSDLQRKDYLTEGIPVLKIQNVKPFSIILKKMDYISDKKYEELKRHSFKSGDIVMTKLGEPLGISAIIPNDIKEGVIVADLVRIRANKINKRYLCYVLNSPHISHFINSKQKGTTRARVKLSIIRDLLIPYVSEKDQTTIVSSIESKFSVIDKVEEVVNQSLIKAETLRKSILKSAFEGRLVKMENKLKS